MAVTSMSSTDLAGPNSVEVVKTPALADPLPIGAAGFALTTLTLSLYNAGIPHAKGFGVVLPIALFYGGLAQFMAGMWEIRRNNMFGAMVFTSFGAFWMSFAAYVHFIVPTLPPAIGGQVTGIFLVMWTVVIFYLTIPTFKLNGALLATFLALDVTVILLDIGNFATNTSLIKAGGYFGMLTAVLAWYLSAATLINSVFGRTVLPLYPFSS